jgi:hypothetical protein
MDVKTITSENAPILFHYWLNYNLYLLNYNFLEDMLKEKNRVFTKTLKYLEFIIRI